MNFAPYFSIYYKNTFLVSGSWIVKENQEKFWNGFDHVIFGLKTIVDLDKNKIFAEVGFERLKTFGGLSETLGKGQMFLFGEIGILLKWIIVINYHEN